MRDLRIKNMVCDRCRKSVSEILTVAGLLPVRVDLGRVLVDRQPTDAELSELRILLRKEGFELLDDARTKLTDEIKKLIIDLVHYSDLDSMKQNLSVYLANQLHKDYNYLSNLFSSVENTTIEQFFILQKIEKIKEWLVYDELTLTEMSFKLAYSSVAHLSSQFKKVTGFSPTQFKKLKDHHRKPLDKVYQ